MTASPATPVAHAPRRDRRQQVAALLYHHVGPVRQDACKGLTVTSDGFSRQIGALAAMGYETIYPEDWAAWVRGERDIPRYALIVTFDDGYADLVHHAFPVLKKRGFGCTVFIPTELIGGEIPCSPQHPEAKLPIMSAAEIAEWAGRGVHFGAHSRTHTDLTTLSDSDLEHEIAGSRDDLAAITGRDVTSFAFPYGRFSPAVVAAVEKVFSTAFTIQDGLNGATTPLSMLNRTMVQHRDSMVDVCLRARFGRSVLERVRTATGSGSRDRAASVDA